MAVSLLCEDYALHTRRVAEGCSRRIVRRRVTPRTFAAARAGSSPLRLMSTRTRPMREDGTSAGRTGRKSCRYLFERVHLSRALPWFSSVLAAAQAATTTRRSPSARRKPQPSRLHPVRQSRPQLQLPQPPAQPRRRQPSRHFRRRHHLLQPSLLRPPTVRTGRTRMSMATRFVDLARVRPHRLVRQRSAPTALGRTRSIAKERARIMAAYARWL